MARCSPVFRHTETAIVFGQLCLEHRLQIARQIGLIGPSRYLDFDGIARKMHKRGKLPQQGHFLLGRAKALRPGLRGCQQTDT